MLCGSAGRPPVSCAAFTANTGRYHECTTRQAAVILARQHSASGSDGRARRSRHGRSYESKQRRRGRPAWTRSPDDSPLRDGNRDRIIGLLTERAAKTLAYYLSETNLNLYHWFAVFMRNNPIPRNGNWDEVSGEVFLRTLLSMGLDEAKFDNGREAMFDCVVGCSVDPRNIAQRIMTIRSQLAKEMIEDLSHISEENALLMRETVSSSFSLDNLVDHPVDG